MDVGIELPIGRDLLEALLAEHVGKGARHKGDTFLELRLLVRLRGLECSLEIVEHRQELLHQPLVGARDQALLVARRPLAVIVELCLDALERVTSSSRSFWSASSSSTSSTCSVFSTSSGITTSSLPLRR